MRKAFLGAAVALMLATSAAADGQQQSGRWSVRDWICGAVLLRYEAYLDGEHSRTRYHVVNPDAISYDRSVGTPRFIVEWSLSENVDVLTLNGWPCAPVPAPRARRQP
jgi:hypothetical protein